jgi:hypothetical protein
VIGGGRAGRADSPMARDMRHRLEVLEAQSWRHLAAEAGAAAGFSADQVLSQALSFLTLPMAQLRAELPNFREAELHEMKRWVPVIRRAMRPPFDHA